MLPSIDLRMITLFSLAIWYSRCRILRLPCKVEASFDVVIEGRILINNVIKSFTVESVQECFENCIHEDSNCKSINHKRLGSDNCQLNNKIQEETTPSNLIINDQWTYYSTNYSTKNVGSYCEKVRPCNNSAICFDTCQCPGYQCIDECNDEHFRNRTLRCHATSNVALNKPASISSLYDQYTIASNAVDGNLKSSHRTCAITKLESTSPWLLVDLLTQYHILYVRIKNRNHQLSLPRSQPFDVRVGNSNQNGGISNDFCVHQGSIPTVDTIKRFDCAQGTRGRYISFHTPPIKSYLELCELEAYGFEV